MNIFSKWLVLHDSKVDNLNETPNTIVRTRMTVF